MSRISRPFSRPLREGWSVWLLSWASVLLLVVCVVAPLGALLLRSFHGTEIVTTSGARYLALDDVQVTPNAFRFSLQERPGAESIAVHVPASDVASVRRVFTLRQHAFVWQDPRTLGLLRNSALVSLGGAFLALLLGAPIGLLLARTALLGRKWAAILLSVPILLPPFFVALGGARKIQSALHDTLSVQGHALHLISTALVFGLVLYPIAGLLVSIGFLRLPQGASEAARITAGRRGLWQAVIAPRLRPALSASFLLCFLFALTDFAVPDLLGFMLPASSAPAHVFSTEVLFQWRNAHNVGRAAATGVPLLALGAAALFLAIPLTRRMAPLARGLTFAPPKPLSPRLQVLGWSLVLLVFLPAVALPFGGIASWTLGGGETVAGAAVERTSPGYLFDFAGALARTPGAWEDMGRWMLTAAMATVLVLGISVGLSRLLRSGTWLVRALVGGGWFLALATPPLVLGAATRLLHTEAPYLERLGLLWVAVLAMVGRLLPFALIGVALSLRPATAAQEEAAALAGARSLRRAGRIWLPQALPGLAATGLLVLALALRELDAVMLIDGRILTQRLYDKIHYSRLADEANLLLLCTAILLLPALLSVLLVRRRLRAPPGV